MTLFSKEERLQHSRILEEKFGIPMAEKLETEVSGMCNLSQGLLEEGRAEGHAEGFKEATEYGMQILIQTMLEVPFSRMRMEEKLMTAYGLTAEAAAEKVERYMGK